jgi:hypothetical protein
MKSKHLQKIGQITALAHIESQTSAEADGKRRMLSTMEA